MVIYLRHPVHGIKVATMELEAQADEKNGWTRFDPAEVERPPVNALAVDINSRRRRAG
jgi:hypothetical protein